MTDDYKYVENMASILALKTLEIRLKEEKLEGSIIPDVVFDLLKLEIEKYGENIKNTK